LTNGRAFSLSEDEAEIADRSGISLRLCDRAGALVAVGKYDPIVNLVRPSVVIGGEVV